MHRQGKRGAQRMTTIGAITDAVVHVPALHTESGDLSFAR